MIRRCQWCGLNRDSLPSGVLICGTCDLTPVSSIPILEQEKPDRP